MEMSLSLTNKIYKWHKLFLEGREEAEDAECPGQPCSVITADKISQNGFREVFLKWVHRWEKCIMCNGRYFEKE